MCARLHDSTQMFICIGRDFMCTTVDICGIYKSMHGSRIDHILLYDHGDLSFDIY